MITGIDTYLILTPRYNDAVLFHRDVLALPIVLDMPGMTMFEAGDCTITVARSMEEAEPLLSFLVEDFADAFDRLQAAGVSFDSDPQDIGDGAAFASFRAPGGGRYGIYRPPEGGA